MKIHSPINGLIVHLNKVDDPVFSQKIVGDGLAIDPTSSTLFSPFNGQVSFLHPNNHAVTLKSNDGYEILIHIGIDTVNLKGHGFKANVISGQSIKQGDRLIDFDLDLVSTQAKSPQVIVVCVSESAFISDLISPGKAVEALKEPLFTVEKSIATTQKIFKDVQNNTAPVQTKKMTCLIPSGLHARPAATLSKSLQKFTELVQFRKDNTLANAKSMTSLLSLGLRFNDDFIVETTSSNSQIMFDLIENILKDLSLEVHDHKNNESIKASAILSKDDFIYNGVTCSPGLVLAKIKNFKPKYIIIDKTLSESKENEVQRFELALENAIQVIKKSLLNLDASDKEKKGIYEAHIEILSDPEIIKSTFDYIDSGFSADYAWQSSLEKTISTFKSSQNSLLIDRIHDLKDVEQSVLRFLTGAKDDSWFSVEGLNDSYILIARQLTPSDMSKINPQFIKGLCLVEGGASSHVAIIARSMGIAMISAVDESVLTLDDEQLALLDASNGTLKIKLTENDIHKATDLIHKKEKQTQDAFSLAQKPAMTKDGHHIDVFANIGKVSETKNAVDNGAEGVGLLRSEFLFLDKEQAPTEKEQLHQYQSVVNQFTHLKNSFVIIRTLDIGGDKPLKYLPLDMEENPFLGLRGLRLSLRKKDLFLEQIRALLQIHPQTHLKIMLPMVTTVEEVIEAKKLIQNECVKMQKPFPSLGIMIEVPSAALIAEALAPYVDFFSIGSNDLTQYTLAVDRGHKQLSSMADGLHPSILKLIHITCSAAHKHNKYVGICGGIAGDELAVPLLLGLGINELSVSIPSIAEIKSAVRKLNKFECENLALQSLSCQSAGEVRHLVKSFLNEKSPS